LSVFARHAESAANVGHVLSTDPSRPVALTERGRAQARASARSWPTCRSIWPSAREGRIGHAGRHLPLDRAADGLAALASGEARGTMVVQVGS
jgi:hypothetical protein